MSETPELQQSAVTTVREFLAALEMKAVDEAVELLDPGVVWKNTSLPDMRGAERVGSILRLLDRGLVGFRVDIQHIAAESEGHPAAEGQTVLTERTDYLRFGPIEFGFWVCGTFELVDGRITLWHDHFSWENLLRGLGVGILRGLRPRRPA
ncbi:nuclear transport factor 2 family protein [Nocardia sp. CDC159]|uniref:Nuclear transport factor 2 family protein n=1 Tax=Nocardia pulmonis TaxID=2951408 RepID=A0A9X2E887_9NOCA|nr:MULTISPECIES: limonene-1,2-epoxide hydrolase family protein [Nocardia]MCM6775967.1 nuclear transport factor 2 family protein [Nocardia pulmonis]MCM6788057.1 nuclear transport factor 2 family protein [Nocardia sp. CDC159]